MKIISERQAQELADLSGCEIYTCMDGAVKIKGRYYRDVLPLMIDVIGDNKLKTWKPQNIS